MERLYITIRRLWHRLSPWRALVPTMTATLLLLSLLRGIQGFNVYDDGFVLSSYALVFSAPGSVAYSFLYYWQTIVGGLWNAAFGGLGIYGFRVLEVAVLGLNAFLAARLAGMAGIGRGCVAVGLVLAFSRLYWIEVFEYNTFSALAALLIALLTATALAHESLKWMFAAGVAFGLGVFIRLPNAALCLLALVLVPFHLHARCLLLTLRLLAAALMGTAAGVLLTFGCMAVLGHLDHFSTALADAFFLAGNAANNHGMGSMLSSLAVNYGFVAVSLVAFTLFPALYIAFGGKPHSMMSHRLLTTLLFAAQAFAVAKGTTNSLFMMNAMCIISCLYVCHACRNRCNTVCIATLALLIEVALPLGSDGNINTIGVHNMWLALPFVPYAAHLWLRRQTGRGLAVRSAFAAFTLALLLARNAYGTWRAAYYEPGTRLDDTCAISHPRANVLTDAKTATDLDGLLVAMRTEVAVGDTMLTTGSTPMLHYLTLTMPYLDNSWPWIFGADYCERQLKTVRAKGARLPVVVLARVDMAAERDRREVFMRFLRNNNYTASTPTMPSCCSSHRTRTMNVRLAAVDTLTDKHVLCLHIDFRKLSETAIFCETNSACGNITHRSVHA